MAKWKPIPHGGPLDGLLRRLVAQLNDWATDKDRFEKVVASPSDTVSGGASVSLRKGRAIESSRVGTDNSGTLNPLDVTGSLIPTLTATYDVGQNTPARRWRDLFLSRNADIDGALDVASAATLRSTATIQSATISTGLTVTNHVQTANLTVTSGATFTGIVSGFSSAGGIAPNKANAATYLGRDPGGNGYDWDYISGNTCQFGVNAFNSTFAVNNQVIILGEAISDPVYLLSGITSVGDAWFQGSLAVTGQFPYGLSVNGLCSIGSTVTVNAQLGVTNLTALAGGLTVSSGATFNGDATFLQGVSITGGTVTIYPGSNNRIVLGASNVLPSITGVQNLGAPPNTRWANIFGRTGNFADTLTAGATCNLGGAGSTNTCLGNWAFNTPASGTGNITISGNLSVSKAFNPPVDGTGELGMGAPVFASTLRWGSAWINFLALRKGIGLTSSTSLMWGGDGNYYDIYGSSTILGLSYQVSLADPSQGTQLLFGFSTNGSQLVNGNSFVLSGGVTFTGQTGDHIAFVATAGNKWKEFSRWRASGQLFQPTGDNHPAGTAAIGAGGSINVTCNLVGTSSMIFLTGQSDSGTVGFYRVGSRTAGASFNILSSSSSDTSTVAWIVIEPEGL